jgi:hypothetical protein
MEGLARWGLLGMLLAAGACAADDAVLRSLGASAPLRTLALTAGPLAAADADPPLRLVAPRLGAVASAAAPLFALPSVAPTPAMPHVQTGGSSFHIEGLRAPGGVVSAALGDHQYVQLADGQLAIYRKDDGTLLLAPMQANAMFLDAPASAGANACASRRVGQAEIHFDQLAKRWIIAQRAAAGQAGPYYLCLAVSASADAAGSYLRYALAMTTAAGRPLYLDDPRLAVWPDAYYVSADLFEHAAGVYRGPRICAIERQALLRGLDARMHCRDLGPGAPALAPASIEGYVAPASGASPALFLGLDFAAQGRGERLVMWRFSFSANRLEGPFALPVTAFGVACYNRLACIAQPAPGAALPAVGDRMMARPVYRNGDNGATLLATHTVHMEGGQLGLRWYAIVDPHGAARIAQQGSLAPDASSRYMGSIGIDAAGDIALGYSVAGADTPPGIRYTGRIATDPPGRMQAEEVIFNGNGVDPDSAAPARVSGALALDPIDGCTFWYTQRYLPSTGSANWHTRIARFKFKACR